MTSPNPHRSASVVEMCAAIEEYDRIARSGVFANGEPTSNDPCLLAELVALTADLRAEVRRRAVLS